MARQCGAQHPAAVGRDDDVVLDADADAPEGLRHGQVVALEVQAGLDGENVPGLEAAAAVLLIPGVRAVVDVEAEHVRCAVKGVAAVELPVLGDRRLLGPEHQLVEPALHRGEASRHRQGARDVRRVQIGTFDPGVEEEEFPAANLPVVVVPMQGRGVGPARRDGAVADVVALDPSPEVEDTLHHPLPLLHGLGDGAHDVFEALDRRRHRPVQRPDLVPVLDQAQLAEHFPELRLEGGVTGFLEQAVDPRVEAAQG